MAIPAAAIAAAGALASTGASAYSQGRLNKKTRKWNEKMHDLTRQEALSDWAMQNEYNSPKAQMQRFRDAGLNPNLIYGQTNEGATVRSADTPAWNPRTPSFEGLQQGAESTLAAYYDIQLKEAAIDNAQKQGTVLVQEAALKAANIAATVQGTSKSEFELSQSKKLAETSLQTAEAHLSQIRAQTQATLDANERQELQTNQNLREGVERILTMRLDRTKTELEKQQLQQAIKNSNLDQLLKEADLRLKSKGVQPGDNPFLRILLGSEIVDKIMNKVKDLPDTPKIFKGHDRTQKPYGKYYSPKQ